MPQNEIIYGSLVTAIVSLLVSVVSAYVQIRKAASDEIATVASTSKSAVEASDVVADMWRDLFESTKREFAARLTVLEQQISTLQRELEMERRQNEILRKENNELRILVSQQGAEINQLRNQIKILEEKQNGI